MNFLCACSSIHLFQDFLAGLNKYLPVTYKENLELFYLNIWLVQSSHVIIIDYTSYIQGIILPKWFPYNSEKVNSNSTPFKVDIIFEISLEETLPYTPSEIHIFEECYLGKFSAHIGKMLHIMSFKRPDIIYDINSLSRNSYAPLVISFLGIKHLICYLDGLPHHLIIYPSILYGTTTHELPQEVFQCEFHSQKTPNGLVFLNMDGKSAPLMINA